MLDEVHDMWVSNHTQCLDFSLDEFAEVLVGIQNFHCEFVPKTVFGDLNFAAGALSEGSSDLEVV